MPVPAAIKKVPTPVWLGAGGVVIGLAYAVQRDKRNKEVSTDVVAEGEFVAGEAPVAWDGISYAPSPVGAVQQVPVGVTEPAETVGAVGQTALETVGNMFGSAVEAIGNARVTVPPPNDVGDVLRSLYPNGIPQAQPPGPATPQTPVVDQPTLPPGYKKGSSILGKNFPNAIGYRETTGPGDKKARARTFLIVFNPGGTQAWVYRERTKKWEKRS